MSETEWEATYGPPAIDAPYAVGDTLIYDDCGAVENGEVLYVGTTPDICYVYVVSPARSGFPAPVWPDQIIAAC